MSNSAHDKLRLRPSDTPCRNASLAPIDINDVAPNAPPPPPTLPPPRFGTLIDKLGLHAPPALSLMPPFPRDDVEGDCGTVKSVGEIALVVRSVDARSASRSVDGRSPDSLCSNASSSSLSFSDLMPPFVVVVFRRTRFFADVGVAGGDFVPIRAFFFPRPALGVVTTSLVFVAPPSAPVIAPARRFTALAPLFAINAAYLFFVALSVRPPTTRAISVHLFPIRACVASKVSSSSLVHSCSLMTLVR